jgi:hypothetical protein
VEKFVNVRFTSARKETRAREVKKAVKRNPAWSWLLLGDLSYLNRDVGITCDEVNKLLEAGFIMPVDYPNWLANLVRMCIYYTSLNKACPKDEYPLSHICQIINSTMLCELLLFLDAYLGYHQISLTIDNEGKITFITPFEIFCYTKMAFGLKNGGATY